MPQYTVRFFEGWTFIEIIIPTAVNATMNVFLRVLEVISDSVEVNSNLWSKERPKVVWGFISEESGPRREETWEGGVTGHGAMK